MGIGSSQGNLVRIGCAGTFCSGRRRKIAGGASASVIRGEAAGNRRKLVGQASRGALILRSLEAGQGFAAEKRGNRPFTSQPGQAFPLDKRTTGSPAKRRVSSRRWRF